MKGEERVAVALAAICALLLAALWLTGAASAAIFGPGWTPPPAAELPGIAAHLLAHPGRPAAAWPPDMRRAIPDPVPFYLTAAMVCAVLAGAVTIALRAARELGVSGALDGRRRERAPASRWAAPRDLGGLRVSAPAPGRLTLGRSGRRLLAAEERGSVIAIAPTGAHKTTGLAIPALLEWQGPVLATSVKSDLVRDTLARRRGLGEVMVFDPAQVTGLPSARSTPLWGARTWRGAMRLSHWLTAAARVGSSGMQDADFWFQAAEKLISPLLLAAATGELTMSEIVRWLDEGPEASEEEVLGLLRGAECADAERAYMATQNREERQRSSIYTTAEMTLAAYADPRVAEESAAADYSPTALLDGRANTLYLCAPQHEQERLRTIFSTIIQELLAVVYETVATTGRPLNPPLLLLLDEAANIAPIPNLDEIASTAGGQGVQLLSVFQDISQISARYQRRAATIVNNHRAKVFGSGISDPETLDYVARIVGAGEFEQRSRTDGERGRASTTEGETYRDLLPPALLRSALPGNAILLYGHLPPARIRLRPWFHEASLRSMRDQGAGDRQVRQS
ncbi:MAG: type IV secretory system conjugative DNA transfer family protein [Solirubrobacterales bacterium]